jgi:hypothetical protein
MEFLIKTCVTHQAPVAHACNPSYLGGRDQEDYGLKSPQSKYPTQNRTSAVAQVVEHLSSNPSTTKKKKAMCSDSSL